MLENPYLDMIAGLVLVYVLLSALVSAAGTSRGDQVAPQLLAKRTDHNTPNTNHHGQVSCTGIREQ